MDKVQEQNSKTAISGITGTKGLPRMHSDFLDIIKQYPMSISVSSNHLICHLISYPVFLVSLSVPFSSLLT